MTKNEKLNAGLQKFAAGNYEDAALLFEALVKDHPDFEIALSTLAETYNKLGRLDDAILAAKKCVELNPQDALVHATLSRLYVQKGLIEEAEIELALSNELAAKQ